MAHKSWREKLLSGNPPSGKPKVVKLNLKRQKYFKAKTLAIPSPMEINELMRKVPKEQDDCYFLLKQN
jgi:hypothetical protein